MTRRGICGTVMFVFTGDGVFGNMFAYRIKCRKHVFTMNQRTSHEYEGEGKTMKRIVCVLLLLACILCLTACSDNNAATTGTSSGPAAASGAAGGSAPEITAEPKKEGTPGLEYEPKVGGYVVTGYKGIAADIVIPDTYADGPVVTVGGHAFESAEITSVTMGSNIRKIEKNAFWVCRQLKTVVLNEGLEILNGFSNCISLTEIIVPSTVTSIENYAFDYAVRLEKVEFAKGSQISIIEGGAFQNCVSLKEINLIDTNIRTIEGAFTNCTGIKELRLPPSCTQFGTGAFEGWTADQTIYMGCPKDSLMWYYSGTTKGKDDCSDEQWEKVLGFIFQGCEAKIIFP